MAFYGYEGGGYEQAQYPCPYEPNLYQDDGYSCSYNVYEYSVNQSESYQVYLPSEAKFTVAYSSRELEDAEFQEYDPTPYDGGYDQSVTYGKPLPPSDRTCYPRSQPKSNNTAFDNFSYDSTPSPYAKGKDDPLLLPTPPPVPDPQLQPQPSIENLPTPPPLPDLPLQPQPKPSIEKGGMTADAEPCGGYRSYEHQNGHQIPYGSGLEAMDICETLFGYWPCVAQKAHQQMNHHHCQVCEQDAIIDPWKAAADYFFGTPLPYEL